MRTTVSSLLRAGTALLLSILALGASANPQAAAELLERASLRVRIDPEGSRADAEAALALLARTPNPDLQVQAHTLLCTHYSERDLARAEEHVARATALLPQLTRRGLRSGLLDCRGTLLEVAGDNARALDLYEQAVAAASDAQDTEMLAQALYSRGYLRGLQGHYATGLADLKRAQGLFEEVGLPHHASTALNGIAILYNRMGDYAQARDIYARALKEQRESGLRREQAVTLHNLGRAHENLGEWSAAHKAFQETLQISRELNYTRGEAYALRGLAAVANANADPARALSTLEEAAQLQNATPDARLHAQIQLARGIALDQLRRYRESVLALREALQIFEQAQSLHELRATHAHLASVYAASNDWRAAYDSLLAANAVAERLFQSQIDQRFATLKVEFDTEAKEKQNELLRRENQANQKALSHERRARQMQAAVIVLIVALAALLATLAFHQWRSRRRMHRLALTDELTGVPNRRAILSELARVLRDPARVPCAALIVDIDHFKRINDQLGHAEGDEALKAVASALRQMIVQPRKIGRLGGEEFVVVLPACDLEEAREFAEAVRVRVMDIDSRRWLTGLQITVSIGVTVSLPGIDTPSTLLQRADSALYDAKRSGRNCVKVQSAAADRLPSVSSHATAAADSCMAASG